MWFTAHRKQEMIGWFLFKRFKSFKADPTTSNIAQLGVQMDQIGLI